MELGEIARGEGTRGDAVTTASRPRATRRGGGSVCRPETGIVPLSWKLQAPELREQVARCSSTLLHLLAVVRQACGVANCAGVAARCCACGHVRRCALSGFSRRRRTTVRARTNWWRPNGPYPPDRCDGPAGRAH